MTAEIAVLNRQAIALAADSAVTVQSGDHSKVWQSANKIFGLSRHHAVGIMVFGSAEFMRIPWDTIIKLYRDQMSSTPFATLAEYRDDFLRFLCSEHGLFPPEEQEIFFGRNVAASFARLRSEIEDRVQSEIETNGSVTPERVAEVIDEEVRAWQETFERHDRLPHLPDKFGRSLVSQHSKLLEAIRADIFQELPLSSGASRRLRTIAGLLFERNVFSSQVSGVVIAGFGRDEYFPSFIELTLEGVVGGELNYRDDGQTAVARDNPGSVRAFAQSDVVYAFMEGVDNQYQRLVEDAIERILEQYPKLIVDAVPGMKTETKNELKRDSGAAAKKSFDQLVKAMAEARRRYHWQPIVEVVSILPKDELAAMAESLVNLTSFRRKVSLQLETVGGPIDVAVISKGDGFVWIRRKNYFSIDLNPHFMARYG